MKNDEEKKVREKIAEMKKERYFQWMMKSTPIELIPEGNGVYASIQLIDYKGRLQKVFQFFTDADWHIHIDQALQSINLTWEIAMYLIKLKSEKHIICDEKQSMKELEEIRKEIDNSFAFNDARKYFPIDLTISDNLINLGIDLVDQDTDVTGHIDLKLRDNHYVCYLEVLSLLVLFWEWHNEIKKSGHLIK